MNEILWQIYVIGENSKQDNVPQKRLKFHELLRYANRILQDYNKLQGTFIGKNVHAFNQMKTFEISSDISQSRAPF